MTQAVCFQLHCKFLSFLFTSIISLLLQNSDIRRSAAAHPSIQEFSDTVKFAPSFVIIRLARYLKHSPVRGSKMIPTRLACMLNRANELDTCRFHGGSCCIDIVHPEGDYRTSGEKSVKFFLGTIEFHLRTIDQLKPNDLSLISNGLHTHHIPKECHHLFKLSGPQS